MTRVTAPELRPTVLIVDDEPGVRASVRMPGLILAVSTLGYLETVYSAVVACPLE